MQHIEVGHLLLSALAYWVPQEFRLKCAGTSSQVLDLGEFMVLVARKNNLILTYKLYWKIRNPCVSSDVNHTGGLSGLLTFVITDLLCQIFSQKSGSKHRQDICGVRKTRTKPWSALYLVIGFVHTWASQKAEALLMLAIASGAPGNACKQQQHPPELWAPKGSCSWMGPSWRCSSSQGLSSGSIPWSTQSGRGSGMSIGSRKRETKGQRWEGAGRGEEGAPLPAGENLNWSSTRVGAVIPVLVLWWEASK